MTGFGQQAIGVKSPVLLREQRGGYWNQYPTSWQRGMAVNIQPAAAGGGGPTGWNLITVNLAKMLKRMEQMPYPPLSAAERQLVGI